jgi:hypothetical protein
MRKLFTGLFLIIGFTINAQSDCDDDIYYSPKDSIQQDSSSTTQSNYYHDYYDSSVPYPKNRVLLNTLLNVGYWLLYFAPEIIDIIDVSSSPSYHSNPIKNSVPTWNGRRK